MKIYIADLAEYNAGNLYGKWLDLDDFTDADELKDAVYSVPKINPYSDGKERNEWAFHAYTLDYDPDPGFGESPDLEDVFRYHELCDTHGEAFAVWFDLFNGRRMPRDEWEESFQTAYYGEMESYKALAEQLVDDGLFGNIPESVARYIDYEAIGRDLKADYTIVSGYCFYYYRTRKTGESPWAEVSTISPGRKSLSTSISMSLNIRKMFAKI